MDPGAAPLLTSREGPVAILTLNRPDRLNAVSQPLYEALLEALGRIAGDRAVRAVVLTGAGRAFCVGADLKAHGAGDPTPAERRAYVRAGQRAYRAMQRLEKPIVAAVNGHAIGAGLELTLSSDLVVISREAKLRMPEVALGTFVGGGTVYALPERVGLLRAKELVLLADFFTPEQAVAWGLANRVVAAEDVVPTALELAARLAARAPVPMAHAKRLLGGAMRLGRGRALAREAQALLACMATRDWREGVRAFHERRDPRFTGE
ncbi:MAG TPA: enoyl-CoA hydratase/isomerase family protein [Longimicrobiales bacterium]|nr:enoyl-CoA hydratase/isomerase family protein [Longimicrobiales bacterium]